MCDMYVTRGSYGPVNRAAEVEEDMLFGIRTHTMHTHTHTSMMDIFHARTLPPYCLVGGIHEGNGNRAELFP